MRHKTITLPEHQAARFRAITAARISFADCKSEYDRGCALFDPVNGYSCAFIPPQTLHVLQHHSGDAFDRQKARVLAACIFASAVYGMQKCN